MEICDNNSKMEMRCMNKKITLEDLWKDEEEYIIDGNIDSHPYEEKSYEEECLYRGVD